MRSLAYAGYEIVAKPEEEIEAAKSEDVLDVVDGDMVGKEEHEHEREEDHE